MNREQAYHLPTIYNQIIPPKSGATHMPPVCEQDDWLKRRTHLRQLSSKVSLIILQQTILGAIGPPQWSPTSVTTVITKCYKSYMISNNHTNTITVNTYSSHVPVLKRWCSNTNCYMGHTLLNWHSGCRCRQISCWQSRTSFSAERLLRPMGVGVEPRVCVGPTDTSTHITPSKRTCLCPSGYIVTTFQTFIFHNCIVLLMDMHK